MTAALRETVDRNDMHDNVHVRLMVTRGDKKTPSQHPSNCIGGPNIVIIAEHKAADPAVRDQGISLFTATVRRAAARHARPEAELPLKAPRSDRTHPGNKRRC